MDDSAALQAFWDQERRLITDNIRQHGVHLTLVGDGDCACCAAAGGVPDGDEDLLVAVARRLGGGPADVPVRIDVPFAYTTGLFGVGHPELIVTGLGRKESGAVLNAVAARARRRGGDLTPGGVLRAGGRTLLVEVLRNAGAVMLATQDYYRCPTAELPGYQLTWADRQGRFPWEDGHQADPWLQPRPGTYRA